MMRTLPKLRRMRRLSKTEYSAISAGTEFANLVGEPNIPSGDKWPKGCGYSSVGRIIAVGERFTKFKVGDRVIVYHGYHTNYNKAKANKIFRVPDGLDSKEAALVIIAAMGLGVAAGAAAVLMLPKRCPVRKAADNAAKAVREEVAKVADAMMM